MKKGVGVRRKLTAVILAVLVFSLIAASAASLGGISTDNLGAETDVVASCDSDGITVGFTTTFNGGEFEVQTVDITGIAPACVGQDISVELFDASDVSLGSDGPTTLAATSYSAAISASAEAVVGVAVVISG